MSFKSQESGSIRCAPLIQVWKLIKRNKYDITGGNKSKLRLLFLFVCFFCLFICFFNMLRPVQIWRSRKGGKAKRIIEMLTKILRASSFALKEEGLRSRDNERHWISRGYLKKVTVLQKLCNYISSIILSYLFHRVFNTMMNFWFLNLF